MIKWNVQGYIPDILPKNELMAQCDVILCPSVCLWSNNLSVKTSANKEHRDSEKMMTWLEIGWRDSRQKRRREPNKNAEIRM